MSWNLSTLRILPFAVASVFFISPATSQQSDPPEEQAATAPAEDPSDSEVQSFYAERLKTAPPQIKELLARLDSQRTANMTSAWVTPRRSTVAFKI
jgi:hypothetical protein